MTDTTHDSTLGRIERVTDQLARINCGKVPGITIYEEDKLLAELALLNATFGKKIESKFARSSQKPWFMQGATGELLAVVGIVSLMIIGFTVFVAGYVVIMQSMI